eukprot:TRINITY_DN48011_c0_g1_i1.p1 TRINITY_DN48011_c0_g1~~TRINITY_DN48011_c0_g1_i1.p1  ORF type:complete len:676 (+),score=118.35 TRINITY_DN48011_c0_g1_i1:55-2082(+)
MPPGRRGRPRQQREKAAQKQWLSDKRCGAENRGKPADSNEAAEERPIRAEEDFCSYYDAQGLFEANAAEKEAFWNTLRSPLPVTLRVPRPGQASARLVEARLRADGWQRRNEFDAAGMSVWQLDTKRYSEESRLREWAERENRRGTLCFQEIVSLMPALILAPQPWHVCLDLCAAPGNKSLQLLEALEAHGGQQKGAVLSGDIDPQRCCLTLHRILGKSSSPASCAALANASHFPVLLEPSNGDCQDPKRLECARVLVDVPCSGDGTARKNAQIWRSWSRREALGLYNVQRNILLRALYLLPPGGIAVYSTCSLNPLENEAVVLGALRKWQSSPGTEGRPKLPVVLLDTVAACKAACGLEPVPGVTHWLVPAPERGGPLFATWAEVPAELRCEGGSAQRYTLRSDMFAAGDDTVGSTISAQDMQRCARFYPHKANTGGFFVAMIQKTERSSACLPPAPTPSNSREKTTLADGRGGHPLLCAHYRRVEADEAPWQDVANFFGLDSAWTGEQLRRGLLFWQTLKGKTEPERITLVSDAVARLWEATPSDGRRVAWARMGVFLFEQLPKGLLTGVAASRWRVHAEGADILAPLLGHRRLQLAPDLMRSVVGGQHRQVELEDGTPLANVVAAGAGGSTAGHHHVCGGVLVGITAEALGGRGEDFWLPGVLTPKQLRLCR